MAENFTPERLREIVAKDFGACSVGTAADLAAKVLAVIAERDAAIARAEKAEADRDAARASLHGLVEEIAVLRADKKHLSEMWDGTTATLAAICRALGCDVDSAEAQALMFREKATTLLHERDAARADFAAMERTATEFQCAHQALEAARAALGKLNMWCHVAGAALVPDSLSSDTFGDGMRAAKQQVLAMILDYAAAERAGGGK